MAVSDKPHLRRCAGCGELRAKKELIRVIRDKDGRVSLDETHRKNGRGAYLCRSLSCLEKAQKRRGLERSLRCPVSGEVYGMIQAVIEDMQ